jgi:hypothetical protein
MSLRNSEKISLSDLSDITSGEYLFDAGRVVQITELRRMNSKVTYVITSTDDPELVSVVLTIK